MSAVLEAHEPSAKYLSALQPRLVQHFELLGTAPGGVAKLRELILTQAVQGKLVQQDPNDDPVRLDAVAEQVLRLIDEGKVPKSRASELLEVRSDETEHPIGWAAVRGSDVFIPRSGNSKLIKGKLFSEPGEGLYAGYSASGQDVWLSSFEYDGTAVILSAVGARCGKAFLARGKWSAIANTHIVWPIEGTVTAEYAMLLLNDENFWIRSGGAQPFLRVTETLQRTVLVPPLMEQSRIVTRVEELMRLCDTLEAQGQLEAAQHTQLVQTLLGALTASATPDELADNWQRVATHFDLLLDRPEAVDALEQTILQLAVRGLLVPHDSNDEPASVLLQKIRAEKDRLIAEGKIKRDKPLAAIRKDEHPFELPTGWAWVRFDELIHPLKPIAYGVLVPGPEVSTGIPFVRIADLSLVDPPEKPEKTIGPEVDVQFQRTRLEGGEILMGVVGSIGKLGIAPPTWSGANIARAICRIVPADAGLHGYVLFLLQTKFMQDSFRGDTRTLAQPTLNVGLIRAALTPMPPPAEQARIVARVKSLRRLCADLRQRLADSQTTQAHLAEALIDEVA